MTLAWLERSVKNFEECFQNIKTEGCKEVMKKTIWGVILLISALVVTDFFHFKTYFSQRIAASVGSSKAKHELTYICYRSVFCDSSDAHKWLVESAEEGFAEAQWRLGNNYMRGRAVFQDKAEALRWFRKAAEQGGPLYSYRLANIYYEGKDVPQNIAEAMKWYRKAAEQGSLYAQNKLRDYKEMEQLREEAEVGFIEAQFKLGDIYERGIGVRKNYAEAVKWYRKAAEQGHSEAQYKLGVEFTNGIDYSEQLVWLRKAAEQGYSEAQFKLSLSLEREELVKRASRGADMFASKYYTEVVKWLRKAAEQGHAKAQYELGSRYMNGSRVYQDKTEAKKWFREACDNGFKYGFLDPCDFYRELNEAGY